jgi:hypothetical protein
MVVNRIPILTRNKGTVGRNEEHWCLLIDPETGERSVRHTWSHPSPYGRGPPCTGEQTVSIDEFLASDADAIAKAKLRKLIECLEAEGRGAPRQRDWHDTAAINRD